MTVASKTFTAGIGAYYNSGSTWDANYYTLTAVLTENSYDVAGNTSNVGIVVKFKNNHTWQAYSGYNVVFTLKLNGTTLGTYTKTSMGSSEEATLFNYSSNTVAHDSDGTKILSFSVEISHSYSAYYLPRNGGKLEDTYTLTEIPRASSMTVTYNPFKGQASYNRITITRASSSFTHTIEVYVGGTYKTTLVTKTTDVQIDTLTWAYCQSWAGAYTKTCTLKLYTYNGSTQIGSVYELNFVIMNGTVPFAIYDNGAGGVGASFGTMPESGKVKFQLPVIFGMSGASITVDFTNANVTGISSVSNLSATLLWSGAATSGSFAVDEYDAFLFVARVGSTNKSRCWAFIPKTYFESATGSTADTGFQLADESSYCCWSAWISGGTGYFGLLARTSSTQIMQLVYGLKLA